MQFRFLNQLTNWIFPPVCIECGREGTWLCEKAQKQLATLVPERHVIPPSIPSHVLGSYDHPVLGKLVRSIKYNGWHAVGSTLKDIVHPIIDTLPKLPAQTVIVPVPLHGRRRRERGFNQSQLIAEAVATLTNWPICQLATRKRYTHAQVGLTAEQRATNLHDAFRFARSSSQIPTSVILVDDVITTGATIRECVEVLRRAGVKNIIALAVAKG